MQVNLQAPGGAWCALTLTKPGVPKPKPWQAHTHHKPIVRFFSRWLGTKTETDLKRHMLEKMLSLIHNKRNAIKPQPASFMSSSQDKLVRCCTLLVRGSQHLHTQLKCEDSLVIRSQNFKSILPFTQQFHLAMPTVSHCIDLSFIIINNTVMNILDTQHF